MFCRVRGPPAPGLDDTPGRPWSAGAESDFDLALSLAGRAVARAQAVLCSGLASAVVGL